MLSTHFVEQRFRRPASPTTIHSSAIVSPARYSRTFATALAALAVAVVVGMTLVATDGFKNRFPPDVIRIAAAARPGGLASLRTGRCFLSTESNDIRRFDKSGCLKILAGRENFLVLGDSHAADLWAGLSSAYPGVNFLQATVGSCQPSLKRAPGPLGKTCNALQDLILKDFLPSSHIDGVIVSARWEPRRIREVAPFLKAVAEHSPELYVIGPTVEYKLPLPRLIAFSMLHHSTQDVLRSQVVPSEAFEKIIRAATAAAGGEYLSVKQALCTTKACTYLTPDGSPMLFDTDHFGEAGSRFIAEAWRERHPKFAQSTPTS